MSGIIQLVRDLTASYPEEREMTTFRVFSQTEMREVTLFRELQFFEGNYQRYLELVSQISELFQDEIVSVHKARIFSVYQEIGAHRCPKIEKKDGFAKEIAKFHCVYEILKLKFDHRISVNKHLFLFPAFDLRVYEKVHQEAVRAERLLYLAKAKEMNLLLSETALNFLNLPLDFESFCRAMSQKSAGQLLALCRPLPKIKDLKDLLQFMNQAGLWMSNDSSIEQPIWRNYLFLKICESHGERGKPYIDACFVILASLERGGWKFEPEMLEALLKFMDDLECVHFHKARRFYTFRMRSFPDKNSCFSFDSFVLELLKGKGSENARDVVLLSHFKDQFLGQKTL